MILTKDQIKRMAEILRDTWDEKLEGEKLLNCITYELDICFGIVSNYDEHQDLIADIIAEYNKIKEG